MIQRTPVITEKLKPTPIFGRLTSAQQLIYEARVLPGADHKAFNALARLLEGRRRTLERIQSKADTQESLLPIEERWREGLDKVAASVGQEDADKALSAQASLTALIEQVRPRTNIPKHKDLLALLEKRQAQVALALVKLTAGEPITPAETVLIENIREAQDGLIAKLHSLVSASVLFTPAAIDRLLAEENLREKIRARISGLAGAGRGTIDPVEEYAIDQARVMMDGAGAVVGGPISRWLLPMRLGIFIFGVSFHAVAAAAADLVTGRKYGFYPRHVRIACQYIMDSFKSRPEVTPGTVRALEAAAIASQLEGRAVFIAPGIHASFLDIPALYQVFAETCFTLKSELLGPKSGFFGVFFLGPLILLTPQKSLSKTGKIWEYASYEKYKKAQAKLHGQMNTAAERAVKAGFWLSNYLPGTRSKVGLPGRPTQGTAHEAKKHDALVLSGAVLGTDLSLGLKFAPGNDFFLANGVHRRTLYAISAHTPRELAGLSHHEVTNIFFNDGVKETKAYFERLAERLKQGDVMAKAELAERSRKMEGSRLAIERVRSAGDADRLNAAAGQWELAVAQSPFWGDVPAEIRTEAADCARAVLVLKSKGKAALAAAFERGLDDRLRGTTVPDQLKQMLFKRAAAKSALDKIVSLELKKKPVPETLEKRVMEEIFGLPQPEGIFAALKARQTAAELRTDYDVLVWFHDYLSQNGHPLRAA